MLHAGRAVLVQMWAVLLYCRRFAGSDGRALVCCVVLLRLPVADGHRRQPA